MRVSFRDAEARSLRDSRRGYRRYSYGADTWPTSRGFLNALFWLRFVLTFEIIESNSVDS